MTLNEISEPKKYGEYPENNLKAEKTDQSQETNKGHKDTWGRNGFRP